MKRFLSLFLCLLVIWNTGVGAAFAEQVTYYHNDAAGTPLAISDSAGQRVWEADYKPFGEEFSTSGSAVNDRRFVGKEKDEETGLNYFGARYLAAGTGRFLAPDSVRGVNAGSGTINSLILQNPQRFNLYTYSLNNPYRYVDPDGRIPLDTIWDAGNILYDLYTGDRVALAADMVALAIPYAPAGATKLGRVVKGADDFVDLTEAKRQHILDGDEGGPGGGHRFGTGKSGKSEFPESWSDDRIIHEISDIATDHKQQWSKPDRRGYITTSKSVEGVDIKVVFDTKNSKIVTGYPTNGARNP